MEDTPYMSIDRRVTGLLKETFTDTFNMYYIGKVDVIPEAALPCIVVHLETNDNKAGATMTDDISQLLEIYLYINMKDGFGDDPSDDTVMRRLQDLVLGQDPVTGQYNDKTVMKTIRQNITLDDSIIDSTIHVEFDVTPRPNEPWIAQAYITMQTVGRVFLPNRT